MPSEPSAEVVFQDGWATIRMQITQLEYEAMIGSLLLGGGLYPTADRLIKSEREKHDRSNIMARFDDNPKLGD